jgi:acyl carrier protein
MVVTVDEVREIVATVFELDRETVTAEAHTEVVEGWDSLGHLNLVLALEQRYGVSFAPDEIPELVSVRAIAEALQRKLPPGQS